VTGKILAPLVGAGLGGAAMFALAFRAINRLQANEMAAKAEAYRLMNATARRGQTVFAGDSITEGYRVDEWFAGYTAETGQTVYNRGISAETSDQLLARWEDTVLALAPSRIVLLIGSNDLAKGTAPETVADNVRAMLAQAKAQDPAGRVTLLAVYPINPGQTSGIIRCALVGAGLGGAATFALAVRAINRLQAAEKAAKAEGYALMNATARRGQTVLAGDSITEGYRVDEWFAGYTAETGQTVYNRGISAETSAELLARWQDTVLALEPSRIVLLIGTNDLAQGVTPDAVAANVAALLDRTRATVPDGRVTLLAVYPINPGRTTGILRYALVGKKSPAKIARLNELLAGVAAAAGATWLDLTADLADATGALDPRLSHDGLHPNAAGYAVITARLVAALTA
jgi:lysophospholipase L1-like esterase